MFAEWSTPGAVCTYGQPVRTARAARAVPASAVIEPDAATLDHPAASAEM